MAWSHRRLTLPVHITDPDALDRLEAVEGRRWRSREGGGEHFRKLRRGYEHFLEMLSEMEMDLDEWIDPPVLLVNDLDVEPVLYGKEGYSRYAITKDGELVLLAWSTRPERLADAEEQGFRISGAANPSGGVRRAARRARRFVTSPAGAFAIAGGIAAATGLLVYSMRGGRFALPGPRPSPGPGRTAVIGDSIVAHSAGFVQHLDQNVPGRSFTNFGVVGQGTERILSDLRSRVIDQGFDEVIVEGGANDLGRSNASDYITSRLRTMVQEAKAAGLKVVLLPMIPMAEQAGQIRAINSIIMGQGRSWGADVVVDTYSPLDDGRGGIIAQHVNPDGIHPTRTGQVIIGQTIQARAYA